jgi:hypothetical protein
VSLTDFTNKNYIVVFVTFVNDGEIQENFFCCIDLPGTRKVQDILNVLSSYLETKHLSWENYVGIVLMMPHQWLPLLEVSPLL